MFKLFLTCLLASNYKLRQSGWVKVKVCAGPVKWQNGSRIYQLEIVVVVYVLPWLLSRVNVYWYLRDIIIIIILNVSVSSLTIFLTSIARW